MNNTTEKRGGKRTIRQNVWGNWSGYEGRRAVKRFGNAKFDAEIWREELQQICFIEGDYIETRFVKREELPALSGKMTFWRI